MENSNNENSQVGNLFICINKQNSAFIDSTFTTSIIDRNPATYPNVIDYLNEQATLYFELFHNNILQRYKNKPTLPDIVFRRYQIPAEDMQRIPRYDKSVNQKDYIISTVLPYIEKNGLSPVEEYSPFYPDNGLKIGIENITLTNIAHLLRKYAEVPSVTTKILGWLKKEPLRNFENKEEILDALKATQYYQINKLNDISDPSKSYRVTSLQLLICNLKGIDKSILNQLYDLLTFQRSHQKEELLNQIWAYRKNIEITKKQIQLCTSSPNYRNYPEELYSAFQYTTYYREFINENITQATEPFHLLLAARKLKYADSLLEKGGKTSGLTQNIYWALKEEGIKDWLSVQIELLKKLPATLTPQTECILSTIKLDINIGRRRKFYGMDPIIRDVSMLTEKFKNNIPLTSEVTALTKINIETENLPSIPFERYQIYKFSERVTEDECRTLRIAEGFASNSFPIDITQAIDEMTVQCPITNPVFHCTLHFTDPGTWLDYSKVKNFAKEFLEELGYSTNPFVVTYSQDHVMHIFTPNIIFYENAFHPICTVQNYTKALKALYRLEQHYGLLKDTTQQKINQYLEKNQPVNKPATPNEDKQKGIKM